MFRSVSKHLVIGMNNFYFYSTFSRFIFNQVFLTFRRVSLKTHSYWEEQFLSCFSRFIFNQEFLAFRSVSKHLVIVIRIIYFLFLFLVLVDYIFNQVFLVFLAFRRVSLKTHSYWEEQFLFLFLF